MYDFYNSILKFFIAHPWVLYTLFLLFITFCIAFSCSIDLGFKEERRREKERRRLEETGEDIVINIDVKIRNIDDETPRRH